MWLLVLSLADAKRPKPAEPAAEPPPPAPAAEPAPPTPAVESPVPRFEKVEFTGCGCAAYLPKDAGVYPPDSSPDGSLVWKTERAVGSHTFAVITVKLAESPGDSAAAEKVLVDYLEFLKSTFEIESAVGLGRGHTLEAVPDARGVIDFWKGKDGTEWAVKAWATPDRLAVFLVYGPGEYPHVTARSMFFDGFRVE